MSEIKSICIFKLNSAWHECWLASTYLDDFLFEPSGTFTGIVWSMAQVLVWTGGSFFMSCSEKFTLFWRVAAHSGKVWATIYWPHARKQVLAFFNSHWYRCVFKCLGTCIHLCGKIKCKDVFVQGNLKLCRGCRLVPKAETLQQHPPSTTVCLIA